MVTDPEWKEALVQQFIRGESISDLARLNADELTEQNRQSEVQQIIREWMNRC
jgi:hypothetical protein